MKLKSLLMGALLVFPMSVSANETTQKPESTEMTTIEQVSKEMFQDCQDSLKNFITKEEFDKKELDKYKETKIAEIDKYTKINKDLLKENITKSKTKKDIDYFIESAEKNEKILIEDEKKREEEKTNSQQTTTPQNTPQSSAQSTTQSTSETITVPATTTQSGEIGRSGDPIVPTDLKFGADGLLVMEASSQGQHVINLLFEIPGAMNGKALHKSLGIDTEIDKLTPEQAVWVLHRIEGAGFGQTGSGAAGYDAPYNHQLLITEQVNRRFGGSIHELLKNWGTYEYSGY